MSFAFQRPVGAPADVAELEYCAALRQTEQHYLRRDGSLTARDIQYHLVSRHGVQVHDLNVIEQLLIVELAGCSNPVLPRQRQQGEEERQQHQRQQQQQQRQLVNVPPAKNVDTGENPLFCDQQDPSPLSKDDDVLEKLETNNNNNNNNRDHQVNSDTVTHHQEKNHHVVMKENDKVIADLNEKIDDANEQRDDTLCMDLVQQTALLLIPELQRIRQRAAAAAAAAATSNSSNNTNTNNEQQQSDTADDDAAMMGLVQVTLYKILQQTNLQPGTVLTKEILKDILEIFGEEWTEELVEEMLQDCYSDDDNDHDHDNNNDTESSPVVVVVVLNEETLLRAMTCDTTLYQTDWENRATSHYQDALMSSNQKKIVTHRSTRSSMIQPGMIAMLDHQDNDLLLKRIYTAPSIDTTVDSLRSFTWSILSWLVLVVTFFAYFLEGFSVHKTLPSLNCDDTNLSSFGCKFFKSFLTWLEVFIELSTLGVAFVYLTTLGNSSFPFAHKWRAALTISIGMLAVVFASILSYTYRVDTLFVNTDKQEGKYFVYRTSIILGTLLLAVQVGQFIRLLLPIPEMVRNLFETGGLKMERWTKKASAYKVQKMLLHALACHAGEEVPFDGDEELFKSINHNSLKLINSLQDIPEERSTFNAMLVYMKHSEQTERVGGSVWVWKSILFRRAQIFGQEGIWLFPRLIATNLIQWFVLICVPIFFAFAARKVHNNPDWFEDSDVEVYEVEIALAVGAAVGFVAVFCIAHVYIPSAVATILRLRSGMIGSLRSEYFRICRYAVDVTTCLLGTGFWGSAFTGAVTWAVISIIAFMFTWSNSREIAFDFLAGLLGLFTAVLLKVLILRCLRSSGYGAFYRSRPAAANFMSLVLECWNLGLTTGYVMGRVLKLLLLSVFYIGRVDTNFFAENVGWLGTVPLDGYPMAFMKDLLAHEAHRHPYMERWALLYLLKLRHKSEFGRRSSAIWRILFVRALFPWLQKYRVLPESACLQRRNSLLRGKNEADATRLLEDENLRLQQEIRSLKMALEKEHGRKNISSSTTDKRQSSLRTSMLARSGRWLSARQSLVSLDERNLRRGTATGRRQSLPRTSNDVQDRRMNEGGDSLLSGSFASAVSVLEC